MMPARRRQRLVLTALLLCAAGGAAALTLFALRENINLFFSPTQVQAGEAPGGAAFRIGGMVAAGSVSRGGGLGVSFDLTDTRETVRVSYTGILPDLFREGQGVVALGAMRDGVFVASQVLAKHDENYMPPEVDAALRAAGRAHFAQ
ncbi:MAG: cytochrome c maturation protein CcmE [Gammaproteobacteria bacterium]|nr:cytochrome c maturation protein CcmE [Gammaproteobacteria bacterium]